MCNSSGIVACQGMFFLFGTGKPGPDAQVGCAVLVPFKNRKVTGYIIETTGPEKGVELKEIEQVLEPGPLFHESMVPFFKWMSDYYMHPVGS